MKIVVERRCAIFEILEEECECERGNRSLLTALKIHYRASKTCRKIWWFWKPSHFRKSVVWKSRRRRRRWCTWWWWQARSSKRQKKIFFKSESWKWGRSLYELAGRTQNEEVYKAEEEVVEFRRFLGVHFVNLTYTKIPNIS